MTSDHDHDAGVLAIVTLALGLGACLHRYRAGWEPDKRPGESLWYRWQEDYEIQPMTGPECAALNWLLGTEWTPVGR